MKTIPRILLAAALSGGLALSAFGAAGGQASIVLQSANVAVCNTQDNKWTLRISDGVDFQQNDTNNAYSEGPYVLDGNGDPVLDVNGNKIVFHPTIAPDSAITWNVNVTKVATSQTITVAGYLIVTNGGVAPATIGNIVVNLQKEKKVGKKTSWVSAAADMAVDTLGNGAQSANILAAASAEDPTINHTVGAGPVNTGTAPANTPTGNYYVGSGGKGTFIKTAGSGNVEFTDLNNNSIFNITSLVIPGVGNSADLPNTITLLYRAEFNNDVLDLDPGAPLRVETIVTFGNSGARGGSGATASGTPTSYIDINGNGSFDADESNVRSVPTRVTIVGGLPTQEICNNEVRLDGSLFLDGTGHTLPSFTLNPFETDITGLNAALGTAPVTVNNGTLMGHIFASQSLTGSVNKFFSGTLTAANAAGVGGAARLTGDGESLFVNDLTRPIRNLEGALTGFYEQFEFVCCPAVNLLVAAWPLIGDQTTPEYVTYSQGGYQGGGEAADLFAANFYDVFSNVLSIGTSAGNNITWNALVSDPAWIVPGNGNDTTTTALQSFLAGGGPSGALTEDLINEPGGKGPRPGGALAVQTLTLTLNIGFNDASFGELKFKDKDVDNPLSGILGLNGTQAGLLKGTIGTDGPVTISKVLAAANTALGSGALPAWAGSVDHLQQIVEALNTQAFHDATWLAAYLGP
jgi:hypothetical protein